MLTEKPIHITIPAYNNKMKQTKYLFFAAIILCLPACNGSSIDGKAQEEHYHHTDSMHTAVPSVEARPYSVPEEGAADTSIRKTEGTSLDSLKTTANPLYKGDNSDTGKTAH